MTGGEDITNSIDKGGEHLLMHFNQDKVSNQSHTISNSERGEVDDEDTMEGDIDVETSSSSSRSTSPAVDMSTQGMNKSSAKNEDQQDDPQDLSMKKGPLIIAPLIASSMEKLNDLSSSTCINIEPIMSPFHERFDHKDCRCSPPGLHVIVPVNTSSQTITNSLNAAAINTKLGGQCIGDKNG